MMRFFHKLRRQPPKTQPEPPADHFTLPTGSAWHLTAAGKPETILRFADAIAAEHPDYEVVVSRIHRADPTQAGLYMRRKRHPTPGRNDERL